MKKFKQVFSIAVAIAIILSFTVLPASAKDVDGDDVFESAWEDTTTDTIKFTNNISFTESPFDHLTKDFVIDLNGKTLNINGGESDNSSLTRLIIDGGNLTIKNGTINLNFNNLSQFHINSGSVTLENVIVNRGNETITGTSVFEAFGGTVNLSGVTANNLDHMFNAHGYAKVTSTNSSLTGNGKGYFFKADGDASFVSEKDKAESVASIFEVNGNANITLNKFSGNTINSEDSNPPTAIVLNGGTVTMNDSNINSGYLYGNVIENNGANLTISGALKDGNYTSVIKAHAAAALLTTGGTTTVDTVKFFSGENNFKNDTGTVYYKGGNLTIENSYIDGDIARYCFVADNDNLNEKLIINSGKNAKFEGTALIINGNISINGGTFKGVSNPAIISSSSDKILGALGDGYAYYSEDGVNQTKTESIDFGTPTNYAITSKSVVVEKTKGTVIEGADQETTDTSTIKSIRSDFDYKYFFDGEKIIGEVKVDGKTVAPSNYTHKEGSTIITFTDAFLKTLSVGKHTVAIISNVFGNEVVSETTLTIKEAPTPTPTPKEEAKEETKATEPEAVADTADTNMIGVFAALTALSAAGYVTVKKKEN